MIPFTRSYRKCKLICGDRKQICDCLGMSEGGEGQESGILKGHEKALS